MMMERAGSAAPAPAPVPGHREIMKRSPSELAFEEFLSIEPTTNHHHLHDQFFEDDLYFTQEVMNGISDNGDVTESLQWPQNPISSKLSWIACPTIDSQSSICGNWSSGTPLSGDKTNNKDCKVRVASSCSSGDRSDEEEPEIEAGPCVQSTDPINLKRDKRRVSNRESAKRSRERKQAQMADLESQVERLREENACLYKQFTDVIQQIKVANTNYRVLKSDVEALRAKVRLAEEVVSVGSLTCGMNQHLPSHLSPLQPFNSLRQLPNVSPTITVHGNGSSYSAVSTISGVGHANPNINNANDGVIGDAVSCVTSDVWP